MWVRFIERTMLWWIERAQEINQCKSNRRSFTKCNANFIECHNFTVSLLTKMKWFLIYKCIHAIKRRESLERHGWTSTCYDRFTSLCVMPFFSHISSGQTRESPTSHVSWNKNCEIAVRLDMKKKKPKLFTTVSDMTKKKKLINK